MPSVVVIEDDPSISDLLSSVLEAEGFDVRAARDAESGIDIARSQSPDFVVLDYELPGVNGQEACRRIRSFSDAYVIMLTARCDEIDKITSFNMGADDYVTKPFSTREFVTRLHAMSRRPRTASAEVPGPTSGLNLDPSEHSVAAGDSKAKLTPTEFAIVRALDAAAPAAISRTDVLRELWGTTSSAHVLDVHLSNIRRKFKKAGVTATVQSDREGTLRLHY